MSDELEARACSGCLDLPQENAVEWHEARVAGWALPPDQIKHIEIFIDGHCIGVMKLGESKRPDLSNAFPHVPDAESGGFDGIVSLGGNEGPCEIVVNALMHEGTTVLSGNI